MQEKSAAPANASSRSTTPAIGDGSGGDVGTVQLRPVYTQPTAPAAGAPSTAPAAVPAATQPAAKKPGAEGYRDTYSTEKNSALQIEFFSVSTGFALAFPAFVKSFSDTFNMEWNTDSVFGRMDPIATYKNTRRVINCSFTVPGDSQEQVILNNQKFAKLVSLMYPNYDTNDASAPAVIASAPLFKVRYTNLIANAAADKGGTVATSGLLGYFTEFKYDPDPESNIFVDKDEYIYAQSLNCNFSFNIIHTHRVGHTAGGRPFFQQYPYLTTGDGNVMTNKINILK